MVCYGASECYCVCRCIFLLQYFEIDVGFCCKTCWKWSTLKVYTHKLLCVYWESQAEKMHMLRKTLLFLGIVISHFVPLLCSLLSGLFLSFHPLSLFIYTNLCLLLPFLLCFVHRLGLVVKASASRVEDPGFESRLCRDFFDFESYQWLKNWHSSGYPARRLAL